MVQRLALGLAWVLSWANAGAAQASTNVPLMDALFVDHAVLQRDRPIDVYGRAAPGDEVTVTIGAASSTAGSATATARADANGRWNAQLPAQPAGGPHVLTARAGSMSETINDVLIGDVWLCSGQSNMEFAVRSTHDAGNEAALSANPRIRSVTIPRGSSAAPLEGFPSPLEWKLAAPGNTEHFSAVCYYFVRELQKVVDVPQGIIHSSWGGSRIEPWMSEAALRQQQGYEPALDLMGEYRANKPLAFRHWGDTWQKWWAAQGATGGKRPWLAGGTETGEWKSAPTRLDYWEKWGVHELDRWDGMVWFRARVNLTAAQARQAAKLSMGAIDDVDVTWVNGRAVGNTFGLEPRVYDLPAKLLKAGDNHVVVNVHDFWGDGGMYGPAADRALVLADGSRVPVSGWEYQVAPPDIWPPHAPWETLNGVDVLYNAMIAPLGKYGLRGIAWYQGEANGALDDARRYQPLLQGLMADWRRQFGAPLPWLVVQLANWNPLAKSPVDSGWAQLRDAQRRAVAADGNAGLAVTIDIGDRIDIHPMNKQEVGRRLARAARHVVYGEKISPSGAQPEGARRAPEGVLVTLGGYDDDLQVIGSKDPSGFELCGATQETCRFVRAELQPKGHVLLTDAAAASATRVRFCWADSPLCNLFDTTGLPVGPFEIDVN
ncbi:MAG TPA: sialate O-acetylesterase [Steroidobacteraceae bacterium]|nr:sialate O-acetylesterase [Steroidobacteraceae bacterium]